MTDNAIYEVTYIPESLNLENKKSVGRPKGTMRPPTLEVRYPIRWKLIYDEFLKARIDGLTNKAIALKFDYSEMQVCNVLNSPLAKEKLQEIREKVIALTVDESATQETLEKSIRLKALNTMDKFLDNDTLAMAAPIPFVSQAIKIAGLGKVGGIGTQINVQNNNQKTLVISGEMAENVTKALEISKEIGLNVSTE